MAFMKGRLVHDAFYYGEPWTIGLKRYADDLQSEAMNFYFRPIRSEAPYLGDLRKEAVPDFSNGPVVDVKRVEIIPEYQFSIRF